MDYIVNELDAKRNLFWTGKVEDWAKRKGWFFGSFMDEPALRSDLVEIAWQKIPHLSPDPAQKHFHAETVEVNIVISGWICLMINCTPHRLSKGEFFVIWPHAIVQDISTGKGTELVVVRAPSRPLDKFAL